MLIKSRKSFPILIIILLSISQITAQTSSYPSHIAYDIKVERIKFSNDALKITWKMNSQYPGDFIVGRSEKEIASPEDALKANLAGVFNPGQDGILIDSDVQTGKKYYYIILARDYLLNRQIDIIKNVNYTTEGTSLFTGPEPLQSIRADISDENTILLQWNKGKVDGLKYNIYRSKSPISSRGELEVAEKLATVEKTDTFTDKKISDYGSYFYAVTITDKNGIEYFTPDIDKNYTSNGIYLKGKALSTPLNTGAFLADKNTIIIKWVRAESRIGKEIHGYEIYRSDDIINSLFKLKFSKLIQIVNAGTFIYTDRGLTAGKYFYAVFPRFSDGTVDINFDQDSNFTKNPLLITQPYRITALNHESADKKIILRWNYTGNTGNETLTVFKSSKHPGNSKSVMEKDIIGTENIKAGRYVVENPPEGSFYYGLILIHDKESVRFVKGKNITTIPLNASVESVSSKKEKAPAEDKNESVQYYDDSLDSIIHSTYYKGEYSLALKELKNFLKTTDDKHDRAKAKLFIAKTYIEQHEYEKSIKLLDSDELKELFPEETKFWFEYAIRRLK